MRTLRISSPNNFHIKHAAVLIIFTMLYITSLVLLYLITGSSCLLTAFLQFPLPLFPISGIHKSEVFFYEFVFEV